MSVNGSLNASELKYRKLELRKYNLERNLKRCEVHPAASAWMQVLVLYLELAHLSSLLKI